MIATKTNVKKRIAKTTETAKTKVTKPATAPDAKKLSQIAAAILVLTKSREPMNCKSMVEAMAKQGLWTSPGGATPAATLYASILRELRNGKNARFKRFDRGQFALSTRKRTTTQR
jgi:hypothetical protein